jgi:hypothetical protein
MHAFPPSALNPNGNSLAGQRLLLTKTETRCLKNLASYRPKKSKFPFPREKSAAVLVALFVGRLGDLYVLLNRYVGLRAEDSATQWK